MVIKKTKKKNKSSGGFMVIPLDCVTGFVVDGVCGSPFDFRVNFKVVSNKIFFKE